VPKKVRGKRELERLGKVLGEDRQAIQHSGEASSKDGKTFTCPICRDIGFQHPLDPITEQPIYSKIVPCECKKVENEQGRRNLLLRFCHLPASTEGLTFDTFRCDLEHPNLQEAYDTALRMAEGDPGVHWLTLLGHRDVGKTHLAIAVCRRWLERGRSARYVFVPLLLDHLRQGYNAEQKRKQTGEWWDLAYEQQMRALMSVELLVLDDFGAQVPTPWAMEKLMIIIDHRYISGLPLVFTTNKALNALPGDDEGRIESRIKRVENSAVIFMEAPEYRNVRE